MKVKCNKETSNTTDCDERHSNKCMYLTIAKSVNLTSPVPTFFFILKEKSYIIQFISKLNQFESLNMSMVPQIENITHKLYVGNSKKEINLHNIFS